VLLEAHKIRVERDDYNIAQEHPRMRSRRSSLGPFLALRRPVRE
jgi:hypothetical protein